MGNRQLAVIHCEARVPWQAPFAHKMQKGLTTLGIRSEITNAQRPRDARFAVLLGTTYWRDIEASGQPFLLVDRASFRDPEYVSLVWNGHGRRGDHCVPPRIDDRRWQTIGIAVQPWHRPRGKGLIVIAGQTEPYTPRFRSMRDWYATHPEATHYRPHPAEPINPTLLPVWQSLDQVARLVTLNSSVGVDAVLAGISTTVDDEGGMAYPGFQADDDRRSWLAWLAWTQWSHTEIESGEPIRHLFDKYL